MNFNQRVTANRLRPGKLETLINITREFSNKYKTDKSKSNRNNYHVFLQRGAEYDWLIETDLPNSETQNLKAFRKQLHHCTERKHKPDLDYNFQAIIHETSTITAHQHQKTIIQPEVNMLKIPKSKIPDLKMFFVNFKTEFNQQNNIYQQLLGIASWLACLTVIEDETYLLNYQTFQQPQYSLENLACSHSAEQSKQILQQWQGITGINFTDPRLCWMDSELLVGTQNH